MPYSVTWIINSEDFSIFLLIRITYIGKKKDFLLFLVSVSGHNNPVN